MPQRRRRRREVAPRGQAAAASGGSEERPSRSQARGRGDSRVERSRSPLRSTTPPGNRRTDDNIEDTCTICLGDIEPAEHTTLLPCSHRYHAGCIERWLQENPSCPVCRARVEIPRAADLFEQVEELGVLQLMDVVLIQYAARRLGLFRE